MAEEQIALIRACYEAGSRRDVDFIVEHADPDVEILDPDLPGGGAFHGPAGVRRWVTLWLETFPELQLDIERIEAVGESFVVYLHQRGMSSMGVPVEVRDAHVWTVNDGRIARVEVFSTHAAALAELGSGTAVG